MVSRVLKIEELITQQKASIMVGVPLIAQLQKFYRKTIQPGQTPAGY
jgi:GTP1/Obg family GTP-binding protein